MLLNILLVFHIIVCVLLIGAVLMQQSEGGALGMGGGPSGFMTARGAGNLLTRVTWSLFAAFLLLSIGLTILAGHQKAESSIVGGGGIEKIDPSALARPLPALPAEPAPGPLTAPTPQLTLPTAPSTVPAEPAPKQ